MKEKVSAEDRVGEIRRKTRKKYLAEEKVRIVLEAARRRKHRNPVPAGRDPVESVLPLEQGVSRGWKETTGRRDETGSDIERSH